MRTRGTRIALTVVALLGLLVAGPTAAEPAGDQPPGQSGVAVSSIVSPLLQYQGRLTDPTTGQPVGDGDYTMTFRLYDGESAVTPLWTETKDVTAQSGIFSTALGDTAALPTSLFNGQALWLGIKVGADPEATPRQRMLPVAYAMSLVPGAQISTTLTSPALSLTNSGTGDALAVAGSTTLDGDLEVTGSLSGGTHSHSGADIISGTVDYDRFSAYGDLTSEDYLDNNASGDLLTRAQADGRYVQELEADAITSEMILNGEISDKDLADGAALAEILDDDGPGSGLDADRLDGQHGSDFADVDHDHWGDAWTGTGTGLSLSGGTTGLYGSGSEHGLSGESAGGSGVFGSSEAGTGVLGYGPADAGVRGESVSGLGGHFTSAGTYGVRGETGSTAAGQAGVLGVAGWTDFTYVQEAGVQGKSAAGTGVVGHSEADYGVYGRSETSTAMRGEAMGSDPGVFGGNWGSGYGLYGYSTNSYGGYFYSVYGDALRASGDASVTGDLAVGGELQTDRVAYSSPRTHYLAVAPEDFVPWNNADYSNSGACGGAYRYSGSGSMVAGVHLPHGAVVTSFKVFFYDGSSYDLHVTLYAHGMSGCAFSSMAEVDSTGTAGYINRTDSSIQYAVIDNTDTSYLVNAYGNPWDGSSLRIAGAVITYEIDEAP